MQEHAGAGGGAKQVVVTSMMMALVRVKMEMLMASRIPVGLRQREWEICCLIVQRMLCVVKISNFE